LILRKYEKNVRSQNSKSIPNTTKLEYCIVKKLSTGINVIDKKYLDNSK
jgi:hypothetical protein